jgi:hypothetical protein
MPPAISTERTYNRLTCCIPGITNEQYAAARVAYIATFPEAAQLTSRLKEAYGTDKPIEPIITEHYKRYFNKPVLSQKQKIYTPCCCPHRHSCPHNTIKQIEGLFAIISSLLNFIAPSYDEAARPSDIAAIVSPVIEQRFALLYQTLETDLTTQSPAQVYPTYFYHHKLVSDLEQIAQQVPARFLAIEKQYYRSPRCKILSKIDQLKALVQEQSAAVKQQLYVTIATDMQAGKSINKDLYQAYYSQLIPRDQRSLDALLCRLQARQQEAHLPLQTH